MNKPSASLLKYVLALMGALAAVLFLPPQIAFIGTVLFATIVFAACFLFLLKGA